MDDRGRRPEGGLPRREELTEGPLDDLGATRGIGGAGPGDKRTPLGTWAEGDAEGDGGKITGAVARPTRR